MFSIISYKNTLNYHVYINAPIYKSIKNFVIINAKYNNEDNIFTHIRSLRDNNSKNFTTNFSFNVKKTVQGFKTIECLSLFLSNFKKLRKQPKNYRYNIFVSEYFFFSFFFTTEKG